MHKVPETIKTGQTAVREAARVLRESGVIVYPTETLYGLGALATDRKAVTKISRVKRRPGKKVLPIIVGNLSQAKKHFMFSKTDLRLAKHFWPGPLSLILKIKSPEIKRALKSKDAVVRFSSGVVASEIALLSGAPIVSTSANISGHSGCFTVSAVKRQFANSAAKPDLYVDGGRLRRSPPSTIIRTQNSKITAIREGKVKIKTLEEFLKIP